MNNLDNAVDLDWRCHRGYKAISFRFARPSQLKEWVYAIWGMDIFFGPVPFLKAMVFANLLIWAYLFYVVNSV